MPSEKAPEAAGIIVFWPFKVGSLSPFTIAIFIHCNGPCHSVAAILKQISIDRINYSQSSLLSEAERDAPHMGFGVDGCGE